MNPEQEFQELYERMYCLCQENGWGDPFSYARSREIYMANALGHKVATTYSGADAYEVVDGQRIPVEYKSTICDKINTHTHTFHYSNAIYTMLFYLLNIRYLTFMLQTPK